MIDTSLSPMRSRTLEFGIYRDGDNNLDAAQSLTVAQALKTSMNDAHVEFTVQDTTGLLAHDGEILRGKIRTDCFTIADGTVADVKLDKAHDMADPKNLAAFVAQTLDHAEASGAKQTWIDLVDHGGGDGGGLETHDGRLMSMPDMAHAIADGIAMHAKEHPEDAGRTVDGVVANQCLMATMGFADELSRAGVKYLAASPETMLAPGVPSNIAHVIAANVDDPQAMAKGVVNTVMRTHYGEPGERFGPAAAFDVLDLDRGKMAKADAAIKKLNDDIASAAKDRGTRTIIREDVHAIDGMVRFPEATKDLPWHADRPAIAVYSTLASDGRLSATLRSDAKAAADAVSDLVLAHKESGGFAPFGDADYSDAAGPTIHAPTNAAQFDSWAPQVSETGNSFYNSVDQDAFARTVA